MAGHDETGPSGGQAGAQDGPTRSTLLAPGQVWWRPLGSDERIWLIIAAIWCLVLFVAMVVWRGVGDQQVPVESYRVDSETFRAEVEDFVEQGQVGEEDGIPVVAVEPGEDAYLQASQFQFQPILELQQGETYRLLVSSTDVQHGLSIPEVGLNFQVLPDYLYVIRITPQETGEFSWVCNEYCGLGHHVMTGRLIVTE
jgi:cytochrome c oxidase subunit II